MLIAILFGSLSVVALIKAFLWLNQKIEQIKLNNLQYHCQHHKSFITVWQAQEFLKKTLDQHSQIFIDHDLIQVLSCDKCDPPPNIKLQSIRNASLQEANHDKRPPESN